MSLSTRGRPSRPLLYFGLLLAAVLVRPIPAWAETVPGWRLHETAHFLIYTVDGTPGARDVEQVEADLELMYSEVISPMHLPPSKLVYPLYPSRERLAADWWHFATLGYGDIVHAWGTIYTGDSRALTPYTVTRAVVSDAFPRAIPLLRWGLGEALGDRVAGVDSHAHLKTMIASGGQVPVLRSILAPSDFGNALPPSYPAAVSFLAFLIDRYGLERVAVFVDLVSYQYFDFDPLFSHHFGEALDTVEAAWRARVDRAQPGSGVDLTAYFAATRFVYRVTLAGNPGRRMLLPDGPVVVSEAFRAAEDLRRLDMASAARRLDAAQRATAEAERGEQRTVFALHGIVYVVVAAPLLLAVAWLLWPSIRGWLASRRAGVRGRR